MLEHGFHKGVALEGAAHGLEVGLLLRAVAVHTEAGAAVEVELLARVVIDHSIQSNNGILPVVYRLEHLLYTHFCHCAAPYLLQFLRCPSPLVGVVLLVHLAEALLYLLRRHAALLNVVHQASYLRARGYQACQVHPVAFAHGAIGLQSSMQVFKAVDVCFLNTRDKRVTQELRNTDTI